MGSDDKGKGIIETIAEEAKGVAVEVYKDAAKPTVAAVGGTLGRLVRLALRPIELLAQGGERLMSRVERKLGGVPEDRLLPPPATVAAPAALHYALLGDSDEVADLREMFENLLASSMDRDTAVGAHPAFVSMISQLTPDEARILKSIDRDDYAFVNVYEFDQHGGRRTVASRTTLGIGIGIDEERQQQYISNLDRLGILRFSTRSSADIEGHNRLVDAIAAEFPSRHVSSSNDSIGLTPLGRQFLDTCVRPRAR
jgi:hypothetical protein